MMMRKRDEQLAHVLRRHQASLMAGSVLLLVVCGFQLLSLSSASSAAMRRVGTWTGETLKAKWSEHDKVAAELPRGSSDVGNNNNGNNVAQQFAEQWERAEAALAGVAERVEEWLAEVKRGWRHGEEHFRIFHTHDRPDSSPLKRICLPISVTTRGTKWKVA